jgi:hypothetical protein
MFWERAFRFHPLTLYSEQLQPPGQLDATTVLPSVISNGWFWSASKLAKALVLTICVSGRYIGISLSAAGAALSNALNCGKELSALTSD